MGKENIVDFWKRHGMIQDSRVVKAFLSVPREKFVPRDCKAEAYDDKPLAIGHGQTISQPTTVALMTQALELEEKDNVLEIGTGSGYQAALITKLVKKGKIYTTEIIPELMEVARKNLRKVKARNFKIVLADGSLGYKKHAPYDKIIVTAACPSIPRELLQQLKVGGVMVIPVGSLHEQKLLKIRKLGKQKLNIQDLGDFVFVPLRGKRGYNLS